MAYENLEFMRKFDERNLPSLSVCTLGALELFVKQGLPDVKMKDFDRPIIVGSGNAKVTAEILFDGKDAVFADENNYKEAAGRDVDGAIIFSASGAKHAPIIADEFKKKGIDTYLVTCTPNSPAEKVLGKNRCVITAKNREPYTYNTSTYMGWIFAKTKEDPKKILDFIDSKVKGKIPKNLKDHKGFLLITPNTFSKVNGLFVTKFIELFGRRVARDVRTYEEMKHAITVVPSPDELCIRFGDGEDILFEGDVLKIPLPEDVGLAGMMAIGYYVIGRIQEQHPPYFMDNINSYVKKASSKAFGKGIKVIVE